ncbi:HipA family kinase [Bosea sp. (in: a-proteobacteria)]|jgi:hypothetical protein|uniref:HipA family kinase n=1 Tax=Bosea sp. (in: a-proteobacteria) TaxID=1871050 RepID=UPI003F72E05A
MADEGGHTVVEVLQIFSQASTRPCLVRTADDRLHVMKLAGAGPGPRGLLIEFLALRFARLLGAPVPEATPVLLPQGFPWMVGTDEFDEMIQRSFGWNLGVGYVPDAELAAVETFDEADAAALTATGEADRFLHNVDRTAKNPNLLRNAQRRLRAIDFDACLFFDRAVSGRIPESFPLPRGHLLSDLEKRPPLIRLDPEACRAWLTEAPAEWLATTGRSPAELASALASYVEAWNGQRWP